MKSLNLLLEELPSPREAKLANDPELAYKYTMAIGQRFPAGEKAIATDSMYAYLYAFSIIHGRWPEGEKVIASDPEYAYLYARNIIKSRFPAGEKSIATDLWYWRAYKQKFNIK